MLRYVVPGVEDPLAKFEEVMLDAHGTANTVGVSRGAVRPVIVERLKEVAAKVLPPQHAALVGMTADPCAWTTASAGRYTPWPDACWCC